MRDEILNSTHIGQHSRAGRGERQRQRKRPKGERKRQRDRRAETEREETEENQLDTRHTGQRTVEPRDELAESFDVLLDARACKCVIVLPLESVGVIFRPRAAAVSEEIHGFQCKYIRHT